MSRTMRSDNGGGDDDRLFDRPFTVPTNGLAPPERRYVGFSHAGRRAWVWEFRFPVMGWREMPPAVVRGMVRLGEAVEVEIR